jgi:hypothetical protein
LDQFGSRFCASCWRIAWAVEQSPCGGGGSDQGQKDKRPVAMFAKEVRRFHEVCFWVEIKESTAFRHEPSTKKTPLVRHSDAANSQHYQSVMRSLIGLEYQPDPLFQAQAVELGEFDNT